MNEIEHAYAPARGSAQSKSTRYQMANDNVSSSGGSCRKFVQIILL